MEDITKQLHEFEEYIKEHDSKFQNHLKRITAFELLKSTPDSSELLLNLHKHIENEKTELKKESDEIIKIKNSFDEIKSNIKRDIDKLSHFYFMIDKTIEKVANQNEHKGKLEANK
jgi:hypothetical protein